MQVDGVMVGEQELDPAERILRPRLLHQGLRGAGLAGAAPGEAAAGEIAGLARLLLQQLRDDAGRHVPGRVDLDVADPVVEDRRLVVLLADDHPRAQDDLAVLDHVQLEARHVDLDIARQIASGRACRARCSGVLARSHAPPARSGRPGFVRRRHRRRPGRGAPGTGAPPEPARRPSPVGRAGSPAGRPTAPDAAAARPAPAGSCAPAGAGPRRPPGWPRAAGGTVGSGPGRVPTRRQPPRSWTISSSSSASASGIAGCGRSIHCIAVEHRRCRDGVAAGASREIGDRGARGVDLDADIAGLACRADLESGARCRGWVAAGLRAQECQQRLAALFGGHAAGPQRREAARGVDRVQGRVAVAAGRDGQLVRGSCAGRADDAPDEQEGS